jgi:aminopeptidase-like protein
MRLVQQLEQRGLASVGDQLHGFASELYPICRSITGEGLRATLRAIGNRIPLRISEVPTGAAVLDWTIPREWNIRDAYIKDASGDRVVDFHKHSLHVLNYSTPVHRKMGLGELKPHLFSLPEHPEWIPYQTSYYAENWGFCLTHNQLLSLSDQEYEVCIDSTLAPGNLTYAECFLPGRLDEEIIISCHACHPSLANDNLSGVTVATTLAELVAGSQNRYSYRFLFLPGTIGAITWLAQNRHHIERVRHGLVLTCVGDSGAFHYKKSRGGNSEIDKAAEHVLRHCKEAYEVLDFSPYGYDERQYCSPGFNLAVGCLMRSVWGSFPEYHTSADNLEFILPASLADSLRLCAGIVDVLEGNQRYRNLSPHGEPQLGKRGLYRAIGGAPIGDSVSAMLWVLNFSDGKHSLLDIAVRSGMPFSLISDAGDTLYQNGLLATAQDGDDNSSVVR